MGRSLLTGVRERGKVEGLCVHMCVCVMESSYILTGVVVNAINMLNLIE